MKQLIVAADDFGIARSVNEGIVKARREGIVTAVNFLPAGEAFDDAVKLAGELKLDSIGAHLALTEVSPHFPKGYFGFFLKFFTGKISENDVRFELGRQLDRLKKTGLPITNINSHQHIHMMPRILKIFIELAKEYGIPSIRLVDEEGFAGALNVKKLCRTAVMRPLSDRARQIIKERPVLSAEHSAGFLNAGKIGETEISDIVKKLKEGTTELIMHPGLISTDVTDKYRFHLDCEKELAALTSPRVKSLIQSEGIKLISYSEFLAQKSR